MGYAISDPVLSGNVVSVDVLTPEGAETLVYEAHDQAEIRMLTGKVVNLGGAIDPTCDGIVSGSFVEFRYNSNGDLIDLNELFTFGRGSALIPTPWFDTMKYGAELSPVNGKPGNMIASGWILNKTVDSIVVGDTNRFEETYTLASDIKVYELNTESQQLTSKTLADLPVTAKTDGKYSLTSNRQMVVVVFDQNYQNANAAQVKELYYITPQNVISEKLLIPEYDTMALYSYYPDTETGGVVGKPSLGSWISYTKPFPIVEDKMYFVGDNDVANYLFDTGSGLAILDTGWPANGYLYYLAIEELGFDPRDIKYILLSHGHLDHYGTANDFKKMISNAGGSPVVYETYEDAVGYDMLGFPDIGPTIPDPAVLHEIDRYYAWEQWLDLGGGVRIYPIMTPGHTPGTGSFIFEVTPDGGDPIRFGYMGGFGTVHTPDQGYRRSAFVYGLRYLQQTVDVDFSLPQHTAHFPMLELNKAAEEAGISFLDALVPGNDEWCNFLERRLAAQEMQIYHDRFAADPTIEVEFPDGTVKEYETQKAAPRLQSNELSGPWKRDAGQYEITLADGGKLLHGFNVLQNSNPLLDGIYNSNGDNLGDGVIITRDGYMHDPDKWFIQVSVHVDDDYEGKYTDLVDALNGPVESIRGEGWAEIVRTEYFDTKEEAEAVLATLQSGKVYTVSLDRNSNILLNDADIMATFR